ncbi:Uncharacterised protein [Klebsiella oxytoca]|nr:Uncharacterised protein [Klebsiella oxytoca]
MWEPEWKDRILKHCKQRDDVMLFFKSLWRDYCAVKNNKF